MLSLRGNQIGSVGGMLSLYRTLQMEDLWHEGVKRNTRPSKSGKPMTSRRVIKARRKQQRSGAPRMGDRKQIRSWRSEKKAEEVVGRNELNQVPAKGEGKVVEGRPTQSTGRSNAGLWIFSSPRTTLHLSGDAFVCSLLSSRQPNAIVESVAAPRASRVSTMPALMPPDGSRA
jgi:hypothetical protein